MLRKKAFFILSLTLTFATNGLSQAAIETPVHFGQFYNNPVINLARNGLDSKLEITFDNQRNLGGFAGVSTSYFSAFFNPKTDQSSKNIYGVYFYNDREGDFLFRRKVNFSIARHQQITEKWNLALALSGGIHIFGIKPTSSTGAYSANTFDGNSSLLLYSNKFQFGLAMNQFSNSTIKPVSQEIVLKRHYYVYSQYLWQKKNIEVIPSAFFKYINVEDPVYTLKSLTYGASTKVIYRVIMAGVSYQDNGMYFSIGINKWKTNQANLDFDFSYFIPTTLNINVNRLELNVKLKI